ncbi:hypothetical protein ATANTOWER_025616 [Ataeniobius toweri]|uniref:Uncharacterized protein n=1 Tax=Ataeniobius toweri TaxID=208326 RepID=A0ABU7AKQ4_9TELE|nr:hypothetical protein [Ataeniobius toweri]
MQDGENVAKALVCHVRDYTQVSAYQIKSQKSNSTIMTKRVFDSFIKTPARKNKQCNKEIKSWVLFEILAHPGDKQLKLLRDPGDFHCYSTFLRLSHFYFNSTFEEHR